MIVIIRISGMIDVNKDVEETMNRLRLRRKYSCVVVKESKELEGMLKKIRDFVSYGLIDEKTHKELIDKRGQKVGDKLKPFFRLHPPRGGINSKLKYPKGVLGENKEINKLIKRML